MGEGAHLIDVDMAYTKIACLLGELDGPLKGGADSTAGPLGGLPLDSGCALRGTHGSTSSSSANEQCTATIEMAN